MASGIRFLKDTPSLILVPVLVVGISTLVLFLLGIIPGYIQIPPGGNREYASVEEAEAKLGFDIVIPSYFPSYLSWPPEEVRAQLQPVPMSQLLFLSSEDKTEALLICQILSNAEDMPIDWPWVRSIDLETQIFIDGHEGELIVGRRGYGQQINGVHWRAGDFHFVMVTVYRLHELETLARSMYP